MIRDLADDDCCGCSAKPDTDHGDWCDHIGPETVKQWHGLRDAEDANTVAKTWRRND